MRIFPEMGEGGSSMSKKICRNILLKSFLTLALKEEYTCPLSQGQLTKIDTLLQQQMFRGSIHERHVLFVRLLSGVCHGGYPQSLLKVQRRHANCWHYSRERIRTFLAQVISQVFGRQHLPPSMIHVLPKDPWVWRN